jgi:hypothetical protein
MTVDYNLLGKPINVMESLQMLGAGQERARTEQARQTEMDKQQQFQESLRGAINPQTGEVDTNAARLAYLNKGDVEGAMKFQQGDFATRRKAIAEPYAQAAWDVLQRNPEQQASAWDQYVDQFSQQHPEAAQFKGKFTPELAKAFLAETGHLDEFMRETAPKATVIPQGGEIGFVQNGRRVDIPNEQISQPSAGPPNAAPGTQNTITAAEAQSVIKSIGRAGFDKWAQKNGVTVEGQGPPSKRGSDGQMYYNINGKWFNNPEGR